MVNLRSGDASMSVTTNGPHDVPPTRPSLSCFFFFDKCVTGAGANCTRDNAAPFATDGTRVGHFRKPPRALGLQLPETAAVWSKLAAVPASSSEAATAD